MTEIEKSLLDSHAQKMKNNQKVGRIHMEYKW
jgi:hypothetical protein